MHWRRKWQPTPVFLPGESQGPGSLVGCRHWGRTEPDTTETTEQQQQQLKFRHSQLEGSGARLWRYLLVTSKYDKVELALSLLRR